MAVAGAPTSTSGTSAANQAALERQRELARQRELERQRREAEKQREQAAEAQRKAREAVTKRMRAQAASEQAVAHRDAVQAKLDHVGAQLTAKDPFALPRPGQPFAASPPVTEGGLSLPELQQRQVRLRQELTDANAQVTRTSGALTKATEEADSLHAKAIAAENGALTAQQRANAEATRVGARLPFAAAQGVRDAYDAGSLSGAAQRKLFGGRGVVSGADAAAADAAHLAQVAKTDPLGAAKELEAQLGSAGNDAQRRALITQARGTLPTIVDGATASCDGAADVVKSLARSAQLLGPGDHTIADAIRDRVLASEKDQGGESALNASVKLGLQGGVKDPAVQQLAGQLAHGYRAANAFGHADALHGLEGFQQVTAERPAERAAHAQVQVATVADARTKAEAARTELQDGTERKVDALLKLDPRKLPDGASLTRTADGVTLTQRDAQGEVIAQTVASASGDTRSLTEQTWKKDGTTQLTSVQTSADAATTTQASWKADPAQPRAAATADGLAALKASPPEGLALQSTEVSGSGSALTQKDLSMQGGGLTRTEKTYGTQDGGEGIDDTLDDEFHDGPIDTVETRTFTLPPSSALDADGKPVPPSYTRQLQFSQDGVSATSTATQALEDPATSCGPRTTTELEAVQGQADLTFDGDEGHPKQWVLQESDGSTYRAQTFVEGTPDASVITTRRAFGGRIEETQSGKWFDDQGDLKDVSGKTTKIYGDQGELTALSTSSTDPQGIAHERSYRRTVLDNGDVQERTTASDTQDGQTVSWEQQQRTRPGPDGGELVSALQQTTENGHVAKASLDAQGQSLTLDGATVGNVDAVGDDGQQKLLAITAQGLQDQVTGFALARGLSPSLASNDVPGEAPPPSSTPGDVSSLGDHLTQSGLAIVQRSILGAESADSPAVSFAAKQRWTATVLGAAPLSAGFGALGLAASGQSLAQAIKDGNGVAIAQAGVGLAQSGAGLLATGADVVATVRAGEAVESSVAGLAGKFSVGAGVVVGGFDVYQGIQSGDGWQIAKGGVTAAGAVGGYFLAGAAAGAWGGPAGVLVGVGVGALVFGATKLFDAFDDSEHEIADVRI